MRSTLPWPVQVIWRKQTKLAREIPLLALREEKANEFEPANDWGTLTIALHVAHAIVRSDSEERRREQSRNTADHATRKIEDSSVYAILLQEHNFRRMNEKIKGNASDGGVEQYLRNIKDGPTKFCTCCVGTWFPSQVSGLNIRTISS